MAFSDLEMKKNTPKKLQEKHYADARVNIEQKLSSSWDFIEHYVYQFRWIDFRCRTIWSKLNLKLFVVTIG